MVKAFVAYHLVLVQLTVLFDKMLNCLILVNLGVNPCASGGKSPYLIQGAPTVCIPGSGNTGAGCPVDYTCDLYAAVMTSYCCRTGTPIGQSKILNM